MTIHLENSSDRWRFAEINPRLSNKVQLWKVNFSQRVTDAKHPSSFCFTCFLLMKRPWAIFPTKKKDTLVSSLDSFDLIFGISQLWNLSLANPPFRPPKNQDDPKTTPNGSSHHAGEMCVPGLKRSDRKAVAVFFPLPYEGRKFLTGWVSLNMASY